MSVSGSSRIIFLTGQSGSGKSTVGKELGRLLDRDFIDTDARIVAEAGISIREIFALNGEAHFRELECSAIERIALERSRDGQRGAIVALGGGSLLTDSLAVDVKQLGTLVYLETSCEVAAQRLQMSDDRPLTLSDDGQRLTEVELVERMSTLLSARLEGYVQASITIDTSLSSTLEISQQICEQIFGSRK